MYGSWENFERMKKIDREIKAQNPSFGSGPEENQDEFRDWQEYYCGTQWRGSGYDAMPPDAHNYPKGEEPE